MRTLKNIVASNNDKSLSFKRKKHQLTPIEYLKTNNPQMFASSMFSQGNVLSMNKQELDKYREGNTAELESNPIEPEYNPVEPNQEPQSIKVQANFQNLQQQKQQLRDIQHQLRLSHHITVTGLIEKNVINKSDNRIIEALLQTDRKYYCQFSPEVCYQDRPSPIDHNQTISAPHMHAHACALLQEKLIPGAHVLDIGCGTGILTVIFANLVNVRGDLEGPRGKVVGVEIIDELTRKGLDNINNDTINRDLLSDFNKDNFIIRTGNGKLGFPEKSKEKLYDAIHVGAALHDRHAPAHLKYQLKEGGLMFIPAQVNNYQIIRMYQRVDNRIKFLNTELQVRYVPLVNE